MRNVTLGLLLATGLILSMIGQDVMGWSALWAFWAAAVSILTGATIASSAPLERAMVRVGLPRRG